MKKDIIIKLMYLINVLVILFGIALMISNPDFIVGLLMLVSVVFTVGISFFSTNTLSKKIVLFTSPISEFKPKVNTMDIVEFRNLYNDLLLETKKSIKDTELLKKQVNKLKHSVDYKYIVSVNTKKYHIPKCRFAKLINKENKAVLKNKTQAKKYGYKPCKCVI